MHLSWEKKEALSIQNACLLLFYSRTMRFLITCFKFLKRDHLFDTFRNVSLMLIHVRNKILLISWLYFFCAQQNQTSRIRQLTFLEIKTKQQQQNVCLLTWWRSRESFKFYLNCVTSLSIAISRSLIAFGISSQFYPCPREIRLCKIHGVPVVFSNWFFPYH